MKDRVYTIHEACQHPEAIAKGLRPSGLSQAVLNGRIPATLKASKNTKDRPVYHILESDLLEFLGDGDSDTPHFMNGTGFFFISSERRKAPPIDEEAKRRHLKLQLLQEAREYGVGLLEYLDMIGQPEMAGYLKSTTES